ncbi:MAG: hypothetical protein FWF67_02255 [Fibromonadales bacterium]|nr:hypothetical protein [Fibromonadales bacterium]
MAKAKTTSWLAEMHQMVKEGKVAKKDERDIRKKMRIPNNDVSVETVNFKSHYNF